MRKGPLSEGQIFRVLGGGEGRRSGPGHRASSEQPAQDDSADYGTNSIALLLYEF